MKVEGKVGSINCPDSTLALKVGVLKQAAELAMREEVWFKSAALIDIVQNKLSRF